MTNQDKLYFELLHKDRSESADMLEKPSMSGIQRSVVEKYSDQAHFIYELLQNADDVGATSASFELYPDKLVFKHNGKRHFFLSNPKTEGEDSKNGKLGDLNAITSVANSNKGHASIGKFGVGFKAVFQYTETPYIYDPEIAFKIERFIVPVQIDNNYPKRKKDETVFVFPFNHKVRTQVAAYEDIAEKLKNLVFPILFLKNLNDISFEIGNVIGLYSKNVEQTKKFGSIVAQKINQCHNIGDDIVSEKLWLFSKKDENNRDYCVGFFLDEKGKLKQKSMPAFCFFSTKEVTNLHFIVHAPFLLTDSREGIKAGEEYNKNLIKLLASLSADALHCLHSIGEETHQRLIDDNIVNIVPICKEVFSKLDDKSKISFLPFYDSLRFALQNGLLPTRDGYTTYAHAYWAEYNELYSLLTDDQLSELLNVQGAKFVFSSYARHRTSDVNRNLQAYIDSLTQSYVTESIVSRNITESFIANKTCNWLHNFYDWIYAVSSRFKIFKSKPIFLDSNKNPKAAFNDKGEKTLFLPSATLVNCPTIYPELLKNEKTKEFLLKIVGLQEPELKDYIYNNIIPSFKVTTVADAFEYFKTFFKYYFDCKAIEKETYLSKLRELAFLEYTSKSSADNQCGAPGGIYFPSEDLITYFESKPEARFLAVDKYVNWAKSNKYSELDLAAFFRELGVNILPRSRKEEIQYHNGLPSPRSSMGHTYYETRVDGLFAIINDISNNNVADKSYLLWNIILRIFESKGESVNSFIYSLRYGACKYYYYSSKSEPYDSELYKLIISSPWLVKNDGSFVAPQNITKEELSADYDVSTELSNLLLKFLGIESAIEDANDEDANLTEEQKENITLANLAKSLGINNTEDLKKAAELLRKEKNKEAVQDDGNNEEKKSKEKSRVDKVIDDITTRTKKEKKEAVEDNTSNNTEETLDNIVEEIDVDEYSPQAIDYKSKIEKEKEKQAEEINTIVKMEELQEQALSAERYSYLWFKSLLDMEILNSDEDSLGNREVNITFGIIERDSGTVRTYILKQPNKYIPQYMEDLTDIPLNIRMKDGSSKNVAIEVSSVQSYTLHVKLKQSADLENVNLNDVQAVNIKASRPVFLLQALKEKMLALHDDSDNPLADDYNFKDNLTKDIKFVFGPPGTGKTTYLANQVLIPLMKRPNDLKVLVLTPTNKAADVITTRIMESMGSDKSYENWLTRFGITDSDIIEGSPIFRDKTFDLRLLKRSVTVTTIARFAYDFFMPPNERLYIDNLNWDYIVIDEASMIPLYQIIYPLARKTPKLFIIAGDPFQIEPISTVDIWADENIYKMVNLKSFDNPTTEPVEYGVVKLTTQYRSIPEIGEIFSKFTYSGILKHNRDSNSRKELNLSGILDVDSLNTIKFPVSKYESIYRSKRLNGTTPYQTYSAIFTMEFVNFLSHALSKRNNEKKFSIGIIAPYKAQASLIDRLMSSVSLPESISVQVGTIHGFQGDECDIIMVVLNPPPGITASPKLFLNKQNILNVAISRARDYLFLIMPDNETENIFNLQKIKKIENLMRYSGKYKEYTSAEIENIIFGNEKYIEENSFATSHQQVNVYGQPEKSYEIRSEDTAVDVQVHRKREDDIMKSSISLHSLKQPTIEKNPVVTISTKSEQPRHLNEPLPSIDKLQIGQVFKHGLLGKVAIEAIDKINDRVTLLYLSNNKTATMVTCYSYMIKNKIISWWEE